MKVVYLPVTCDLSVSAINYMFSLGRENGFGQAKSVYYNPLEEGRSFNEWGMVFEGGDTVTSKAI